MPEYFQPPHNTSIMLLAAGHGTRMKPLTDHTPKPLLKVGAHSLIEHHLYRLKEQGFNHVVINTAYLGHKIQQALGNGERYGLEINYSDESNTGALETAGGIKKSLALIKSDSFISINADIYTDYDFRDLLKSSLAKLGTLVLVKNPKHNPDGDFDVTIESENSNANLISDNLNIGNFNIETPKKANRRMTYSGIALYKKGMFAQLPEGKLALGPILKQEISNGNLSSIAHDGHWTDVGTPERLEKLSNSIKQSA